MVYDRLLTENSTFPIGSTVFGLIIFITGLAYRIPFFGKWDTRIYQFLNLSLSRFSKFFVYLWPLGTTPVAVVLIAMTFIVNYQVGIAVTLAFIAIVVAERFVKLKMVRLRPFNALSNAAMNQPTHPKDPSFPSGDAMRVSFLAIVIPMVFGLSWTAVGIACLGAALICSGRIALGVHYPLDVFGGVGLGMLGAGCLLFYLSI
jgi:undecaprenyl-diphosphatase